MKLLEEVKKKMRTEKSFRPDFITYLVEGSKDGIRHQAIVSAIIDSDPLTYTEAIKYQNSAF